MEKIDGKGMVDDNGVFLYPSDSELSSEDLQAFIEYNQSHSTQYLKNMQMYKGHYDIESEPAKPLNKPDNRISVNYAKYLVNVFNGFFAGVPPQISLKDEQQNDKLQQFNALNSVPDKISDIAKLCSIYGRAYMFLYCAEDKTIRVAISNPTNSFIIYDDSVAHMPLYFVHYGKDKDDNITGQVYSANRIVTFDSNFKFVTDNSTLFDEVPAVEFMENDERTPLYDNSTISLMNGINKALSQKANDSDAIADAYLFFKGGDLDDKVLETMADSRVIAIDSDSADAKFLERPNGDGTQENLLDRLTRSLFQTTMVTNLDDVNNSGNDQSGYSIELKMQGMRSLASIKERKFIVSLRSMYRIAFKVINLKKNILKRAKDVLTGTVDDPVTQLVFNFTRNLPKNIELEANVAKNLEGIVSKQTQLKALSSLVDNPQEEIERIAKEEAEKVNNAVKANPANYDFEGVADEEKQKQ